MVSIRSIEAKFFIPHCTGCYQDLDQGCRLYQTACGHMYCQGCIQTSSPTICGVDAVPTAQGKAARRQDLERLIEDAGPIFETGNETRFTELVTDLFSGINTSSVSCKYVRKGIPCPAPIQCKYSHEAATQDLRKSGVLECVKCSVRMKPGTDLCPFCKAPGTKVVEYAIPAFFFPSDAECLTSSLDMMKSLDQNFTVGTAPLKKSAVPAVTEESKSDLSDILKSYVDLIMSDSEEEPEKLEEVVVIGPVAKPAVLKLLRKLWTLLSGSITALYFRLMDRRENTMVFYQ